MLLLLLLLGLIIYSNVRLAKKKGKNPYIWGFVTLFAFFMAYALLGSIYLRIVYDGPINVDALTVYLKNAPLVVFMLLMCGIGGVLLVRFILERSKESKAS